MMKIKFYREKKVQWWFRVGKRVLCGKSLKRATIFFSERNGYKPSVQLFGWIFFIDTATEKEEK
jgi:hypothetical protein